MPFLHSPVRAPSRIAMTSWTLVAALLSLQTQHASSAGAPQFTARPANCQNTSGPFETWLAAFKVEAQKRGVRPQTLQTALNGITYDQQIIYIDRGQSFFAQSFLD
ncbi:MAG: hypothetical protein HOO99_06600, partial [Hyphomicrobiaceae bacterium]|nr:hypothetical protein [Hyphomicrobiaceae bacterium]